eukprot:scaffold12151_cov40-Cyclotella_meneghiniana.AAC.3
MESYLSSGGNTVIFNLGKECIATIASLEYNHRENRYDWANIHDGLQKACQYDDPFDGSILKSGLGALKSAEGEPDDIEENDVEKNVDNEKKVEEDEEKEEGLSEMAEKIFNSWMNNDLSAIQRFKQLDSKIEQIIESGSLSNLKHEIQSERKEFECNLTKEQAELGLQTAQFVKLWYDPCSDEESDHEELWKKWGPEWNAYEIEAHLSFGWRVEVDEDHTAMSFVVDHVGLRNLLRHLAHDFETKRILPTEVQRIMGTAPPTYP